MTDGASAHGRRDPVSTDPGGAEGHGERALPRPLMSFAPAIYAAWADAELTPQELTDLRRRIEASAALDPERRATLAAWLDPETPPSATELEALRVDVRRTAAEPGAGARPGRAGLSAPDGALLSEIEDVLGVAGSEAERALGVTGTPEREPKAAGAAALVTAASFDANALHAFIDRDNAPLRQRALEILSRPEFRYVDAHDIAAYREQVLTWCRALAQEGLGALAFPREFGGEHEAVRSIAVFETLAFHDISMLVKFGVQFGLFAGSIYQLGTRQHHTAYLAPAARLDLPGCFAMTETGHGSNVRDIRTTATYQPETDTFRVVTPDAGATKDYIGNAALHGRMATVFAQLRVGEQEHGVHAFLVPIRDEHGNPLDHVHIEDCGAKEGLNGIDNGRIRFDGVEVPRQNLLDRFGRVERGGRYTSPIASPGRRFFTMIGTLVAGRISIAAASISASKSALTIAVRYAAERRQFGPEGEPEVPILDYLALQRTLLPRLAGTYVLDFAIKDLIRRYGASGPDQAREIEAHAAGFKALASRHAVETIQACREACGGQGYLEVNRLSTLRADTDVFTTFEGANGVLLQLVAKALLTRYGEAFGELKLWGVVGLIARRAGSAVAERNPIVTRRTDEEHLRDPEFQLSLFEFREDRLLGTLARRLKARIDDGLDSFTALNECQDHTLSLARAHVECLALEASIAAEQAAPEPLRPVIGDLRSLWALHRIETDGSWFLEKGAIEPAKFRAIRREINVLLGKVRPDAQALVDAFGIPDTLLSAPIATRS